MFPYTIIDAMMQVTGSYGRSVTTVAQEEIFESVYQMAGGIDKVRLLFVACCLWDYGSHLGFLVFVMVFTNLLK